MNYDLSNIIYYKYKVKCKHLLKESKYIFKIVLCIQYYAINTL